jgi:ABC-type enterochelin transport system substrate-binding protein
MKKVFFALAIIFVLAVTACGNKTQETQETTTSVDSTEVQADSTATTADTTTVITPAPAK